MNRLKLWAWILFLVGLCVDVAALWAGYPIPGACYVLAFWLYVKARDEQLDAETTCTNCHRRAELCQSCCDWIAITYGARKVGNPRPTPVPFRTEAQLIDFLDSLHERDPNGAVTNRKWEPAQRAMRALTEHGGGGEAEDRFEQFVQAGIARSPEPLRELGEYLSRVLDEDKWPRAEALLLQLATSPPTPSAPVVDDAMVERALYAKVGAWRVRQLFQDEDEAPDIMRAGLTAALSTRVACAEDEHQ